VSSSVPVGVLAILVLGAVVLYSLWIAVTLLNGYRSASSYRSGGLAVGLLLLTTVPISLRFGVATLGMLSTPAISALALSVEVVGILMIIFSLYAPGGETE